MSISMTKNKASATKEPQVGMSGGYEVYRPPGVALRDWSAGFAKFRQEKKDWIKDDPFGDVAPLVSGPHAPQLARQMSQRQGDTHKKIRELKSVSGSQDWSSALPNADTKAPLPKLRYDPGEGAELVCKNCRQTGHVARNCPVGTLCHKCGATGHYARECTAGSTRNTATLESVHAQRVVRPPDPRDLFERISAASAKRSRGDPAADELDDQFRRVRAAAAAKFEVQRKSWGGISSYSAHKRVDDVWLDSVRQSAYHEIDANDGDPRPSFLLHDEEQGERGNVGNVLKQSGTAYACAPQNGGMKRGRAALSAGEMEWKAPPTPAQAAGAAFAQAAGAIAAANAAAAAAAAPAPLKPGTEWLTPGEPLVLFQQNMGGGAITATVQMRDAGRLVIELDNYNDGWQQLAQAQQAQQAQQQQAAAAAAATAAAATAAPAEEPAYA